MGRHLSDLDFHMESANAAKEVNFKRLGAEKEKDIDFDWANTKKCKGVCWRCSHSGHISQNCITDMSQEVKERIFWHSNQEQVAVAHSTADPCSPISDSDLESVVVVITIHVCESSPHSFSTTSSSNIR